MSAAALARTWSRFTPLERLARFAVNLLLVAAVVWSWRQIEIIPEFLADAPAQTWDLFARMWPIDWAFYPKGVHEALIETLHMATLGTLLSLILGFPVALLAARNITRSPLLHWIAQLLLVSSRSVNSLIWALLFVAIFGPGALAGVLAIGFRSIGFVGKLLAEAMEEAPPGPIEALTATGASGDRRGRTAAIVGLILCILSVLGGFILGYQMAANSGITDPGSTGPTF